MNPIEQDLARLVELAGLKGRPGIEALATVAALSPNPRWANLLLKIARPLAALAENPHPFPCPAELEEGDIRMGGALMMNGAPAGEVSLPRRVFTGDVLVVGAKGSGKSWLIAYLCAQLIRAGTKVVVLDSEDEYAPMLAPYFGADELAAYDSQSFRMNFHQPVGDEPVSVAIARVKRLLREEWLRDGSINLLGEILNREYEARRGSWPSVASMLARLEAMKFRMGRQAEYWESVVNRYRALNDIPMFQCVSGMPLDALLRRSSIFRLHGLSQEHLGFAIRALMSATAKMLEVRGGSAVFVLDEFHRIATRESQHLNDRGELLVLEVARTLRKRGGGLIFGDQVPSMLPPQVVSLTNTKVVFKLVSGSDIRVMGDSLSLDSGQREHLTELGNRRAVVYCPAVGHPRAFLMEVPELDFSRRATPEEIEERMSLSVEGLEWVAVETARPETAVREPKPPEQASRPRVSKRALDYLQDIAKRQFVWAGARDASLRLSGWGGNRTRSELVDAGLIRLHHMRTGKRGGPLLLTEITKEGEELLRELDVSVKKRAGKGGFVHQVAQHIVAEHYLKARPAAVVTVEDGSTGKAVDVTVLGSDKSLAIEVCNVGENKELRNMDADLRAYDEVMVVCEDPETLERLREKVVGAFDERERERISFALLARFIGKAKGEEE